MPQVRKNVSGALTEHVPWGHCPLCTQKLLTTGLLQTPDFRVLVRNNHVAQLSPCEAATFRVLSKANGHTFTADELADRVTVGSKASMQVMIVNLRSKLSPLGISIRNGHRGYLLNFKALES